jgi:hypothetical protein
MSGNEEQGTKLALFDNTLHEEISCGGRKATAACKDHAGPTVDDSA